MFDSRAKLQIFSCVSMCQFCTTLHTEKMFDKVKKRNDIFRPIMKIGHFVPPAATCKEINTNSRQANIVVCLQMIRSVWLGSVRSGFFCLSFATEVIPFFYRSLIWCLLFADKINIVKIKRQTLTDSESGREREWLQNCCCHSRRTYVRKEGAERHVGIEFMFSKMFAGLFRFRSAFLFTIWCLFIFLVVVMSSLHTFHPFKWFCAADHYQLTLTD